MNLTPDISKKDQIAQYIRGRIRNNYYPAGKRLESVRRLADEFNVSLKIVTDALADLEMEGLVRREAGRGVFAEQGRRLLFVFIGDGTLPGWYNQIIAGVIISREIIITAFRIIAVQKNVVLAADKLGKIKTTFLDIGLIALTMSTIQTGEIAGKAFYFFDWLGQITYYIGAFFAIVSGVNYVLKNKQVLADKKPVETDLPEKTLSETEKENDVEEVVHND